MSIITLTTDYGLKDHFVGALKGKILSLLPEVSIVDISHNIDPFNCIEASYVIGAAYNSFPKKTVHLVGVDLELNAENQHLVLELEDQYFICADNGILSLLLQSRIPQKIIALNVHDKFPKEATDLDIFVAVAVHLSKGGNLESLGIPVESIKEFNELQPTIAIDNEYIRGHAIYIDHFGNVVTNISKELFQKVGNGRNFEIVINDLGFKQAKGTIKTIYKRYSDINKVSGYSLKNYEGQKLAIFNESGFLEIAIFRSNPARFGSANSLLGLHYSDTVTIEFK